MDSRVSLRPERTVLLVEDDEPTRVAMTRALVREGYLVLTAPTAHDAISVLNTPDATVGAVILDIGLPDISGASLCARLRELFPQLPVIVCTGETDPEQAAQLRRLGINHYFSKPFAIEELLAVLRTLFLEQS